jgi:hypothetical protein
MLLLLLAVQQGEANSVGGGLSPGMVLVYRSNGQEQPHWTVDSARAGLAIDGYANCAHLSIRRRPNQAQPDQSRLCASRDTLFGWDERRGAWQAQRPLGPGMVLLLPRSNGDTVRYATHSVTYQSISGRSVAVVGTTVTTVDSLGRPTRRLLERYAVSLATATGGRFETPDASVPGGWRTVQEFELLEIRLP